MRADTGATLKGNLAGTRVALLQGRRGDELASLVRRHGGEPLWVPVIQNTPVPSGDQVASLIDRLTNHALEVIVFSTGASVEALLEEARRLDRLDELILGLRNAVTACRGPKPVVALRRLGVTTSIAAGNPHTSDSLLAVLEQGDLNGRTTALLHFGEVNTRLASGIRSMGAALEEYSLYEWSLPADVDPLRQLVETMLAGGVDAVAFTSRVQVRHLFAIAEELGLDAELASALNERLVVASVAPTCAGALRDQGVEPHVIPGLSRMGPLIVALGNHIANTRLQTALPAP